MQFNTTHLGFTLLTICASQWFPTEVTERFPLHVAAKRDLCAIDPDYVQSLSPASVTSLLVQGGPNDANRRNRL